MKSNVTFLIATVGLALTFALSAAPTPTPTPAPIHIPGKGGPKGSSPSSSPHKGPSKKGSPTPAASVKPGTQSKGLLDGFKPPTPTPTPKTNLTSDQLTDLAKAYEEGKKKKKSPTPTPTPKQLTDEQKKEFDELLKKKPPQSPTPKPDPNIIKKFPPLIIPASPTPTVKPKLDPNILKKLLPVSPTPKPKGKLGLGPTTPTPSKKIIPPFQLVTPTPTPKTKLNVGPGLQYAPPAPGPGKNEPGQGGSDRWLNVDVIPPLPGQLGDLVIPKLPPPHSVPPSQVNVVPVGVAPIPENYTPPPANAPVEASQTALRASNGQEQLEMRAFDQTRVQLVAAADASMPWEFYWKTTGTPAQAARWELTTVPFVGGYTVFPPAGLVGYGDASVDADSPLTENFFSIDFATFAKNFTEGAAPKKYYMRVVPVDQDGNPVGTPSNFIRIDLP